MKKLLLVVFGVFIFTGCTTKVIKKDTSIYQQKQDAKRAWQELDKD